MMKQSSNLLKRLFSTDPTVRYAKQIKQGKVKLEKLPNGKGLTSLRYTLPLNHLISHTKLLRTKFVHSDFFLTFPIIISLCLDNFF